MSTTRLQLRIAAIAVLAFTAVCGQSRCACPASSGLQYKLQVSDTIEVHYPYTPDFDQTVAIAPDGSAGLKDAGRLTLAGLTIEQAQQAIHDRAIRLRDPEVIVTIKEADRPHIFVGGEVGNPGRFELRGRETVMEAIAQAGGFKTSSKQTQVVLVRQVSSDLGETTLLDVKRRAHHPDSDTDPQICPGDYLYIPQNRLSKVERIVRLTNLGFYLSPTAF